MPFPYQMYNIMLGAEFHDGLDMRRLEDLSEDDFDSNKDATDLEAAALKEYASCMAPAH